MRTHSLLRLLVVALVFTGILMACQKQLHEPNTLSSTQKIIGGKDLLKPEGWDELQAISEISETIRNNVSQEVYAYYEDSSGRKQLWIAALKPGTYDFKTAKVAISKQGNKVSFIIASYRYDTLAYKPGIFNTYTGSIAVYNQQLTKVGEYTFENGRPCGTMVFEPTQELDWGSFLEALGYGFSQGTGAGGGKPDPTLFMYCPDESGGGSGGIITPLTPCEEAKNAAEKMDIIYRMCKADSVLGTIPNLATERKEKAFPIYKEFRVSPTNSRDTISSWYSSGAVQTGTDTTFSVTFITNNLRKGAAAVHTHNDSGYNAHSADDVYKLIAERLNNNYFEGSFVNAYNGNQYALTISDYNKAAAFMATKANFLDGRNWNMDSELGRVFKDAYRYYSEIVYNGNPNRINLAYEMSMAAVLSKYNAGVTLHKKDASGKFQPLVVNVTPDPRRPRRTIYKQDCL